MAKSLDQISNEKLHGIFWLLIVLLIVILLISNAKVLNHKIIKIKLNRSNKQYRSFCMKNLATHVLVVQ